MSCMTLARTFRVAVCLLCLAGIGSAQSESRAVAASGWQNYSNSDFGFSLSYPTNLTLNLGGIAYKEASLLSFIPPCDPATVVCLFYNGREYENTNFEAAALSVNILRDFRTDAACSKIDTGSYPVKTKILNGVLYHYGMTGDAATSHAEGGLAYRTLHNGVCFELAVGISETNPGAYDPGAVKVFNAAKLEKELDDTVSTFHFTGPVRDGAAWQVYHNEDVGGYFEYPDGDSVDRIVRYSDERSHPNEIEDVACFADHGLTYCIAAKTNLKDEAAVDRWLKSAGYPALKEAREVSRSKYYVEYDAKDAYYILGQTMLYILSASDHTKARVDSRRAPLFDHFWKSFVPQ